MVDQVRNTSLEGAPTTTNRDVILDLQSRFPEKFRLVHYSQGFNYLTGIAV